MSTVEFAIDARVVVKRADGSETEHEVQLICRARGGVDRHGYATVEAPEMNDARHGKPELWFPLTLRPFLRLVEKDLEDEEAEAQRLMVDDYDRRRFG